MHGWLTLHWDKDSMIKFTSGSKYETIRLCDVNSAILTHDQPRSFREVIENCLLQYSHIASSNKNLPSRRLRLAHCYDDVEAICRLVQGLADFENESDAVNVTHEQYCIDGGFLSCSSERPQFFCILLESFVKTNHAKVNVEMDHKNPIATTSESWYACGMAFFWIGSKLSRGEDLHHEERLVKEREMFLYLEDLFIEKDYRGDGAGTCMMHALSNVALSLSCRRMVWQALDWNTPALKFYQEKVGAYIVEGLLSTRFANSSLDEFHALTVNQTNNTCISSRYMHGTRD
jgi:GNAT superfamily N-acetyltransferase